MVLNVTCYMECITEICTPGKELSPNGECNKCNIGSYKETSSIEDCTTCNFTYQTTETDGAIDYSQCISKLPLFIY